MISFSRFTYQNIACFRKQHRFARFGYGGVPFLDLFTAPGLFYGPMSIETSTAASYVLELEILNNILRNCIWILVFKFLLCFRLSLNRLVKPLNMGILLLKRIPLLMPIYILIRNLCTYTLWLRERWVHFYTLLSFNVNLTEQTKSIEHQLKTPQTLRPFGKYLMPP